MAEAKTSAGILRARMDDQGRLVRLTATELEAKAEAIRAALDEMRAIENGPDEDDAEFFRAIDSRRPDRPLFKGKY